MSLAEQKNGTADYFLTVIVPLYNEAPNIEALERRFAAWLPTAPRPACVLFVDDGSTDGGSDLLREMCARHDNFFYLALARNGGLSAALKAGFDTAQSDWTGYIDADLQTAPEDFDLLMERIPEGFGMVIGIRADRRDTGFKKLQSRIANGFRRRMTGDGITDTGCPLKIIRTDLARRLPMFTGMHRFLPALAQLYGESVCQIPVRHFPRVAGESKYHLWNRLKGPFLDCFAYRWMRPRAINYKISDSKL